MTSVLVDLHEELIALLRNPRPLPSISSVIPIIRAAVPYLNDSLIVNGINAFHTERLAILTGPREVETEHPVASRLKEGNMWTVNRVPSARNREVLVPRVADCGVQCVVCVTIENGVSPQGDSIERLEDMI